MNQEKKIILFYKNLINRGGAELLILKEYKYFKKLGYDVKLVTYKFNKYTLFAETIDFTDLIIFGSKYNFINWIKLILLIFKNQNSYYLISSGRIEFFLASLFSKIKYSIHIHQPLFMSTRDRDKYSIFLKNKFDLMLKNNPLKDKFYKIKERISIIEKIKINLQSIITIFSYKKAHKTFVLSNYSRNEKKILFGLDAIVEKGAIEESIFSYKSKNKFPEFDNFKFKFFTIGRLDQTKRIDILIETFKIFYKYEKNFVFVIAGDGPRLRYFECLVKKNNLENNIFFRGFVSENDKFDYLRWTDLFISIDWADFTITTIEALALGTNSLISTEREIDEEITKTKLVYFTKPIAINTYREIVKIIKLKKTSYPKNLQKILKNYTWETYCKNLLNHIEN